MLEIFKSFIGKPQSSDPESLYEQFREDQGQIKPLGLSNKTPVDINSFDQSLALEEFAENNDEGLLWKIEKDGQTSYVLASLHVNGSEIREIIEQLNPIIKKVNSVIIEIDSQKLLNHVMQYINLPKVGPLFQKRQLLLEELIDDQLIADIKTCLLKAYQIDSVGLITEMNQYQPWWISMLLMAGIRSTSTELTLDLLLVEKAKKMNKKIDYLEPTEVQTAIIGCHWPLSEQIAVLKFFVKNFANDLNEIKTLKEYFFEKKVFSTFEYTINKLKSLGNNEEDQIYLFLYKKMLNDRNPDLARSTLAYLKKGSVLLCMGSNHLFGKNGLFSLIHKEGYKISCAEILRHQTNIENVESKEEENSYFQHKI